MGEQFFKPVATVRWAALALGLAGGGLQMRVATLGATRPPAKECVRWIPRTDVGSPGPRWSPAMAYDSDRGVTVVFGGALTKILFTPVLTIFPYSDTWEYDGIQWRRIIIDGPSPEGRALSAMCYDSVRHEMVLSGGYYKSYLKDTWVYASNGAGHGIWTRKADLENPYGSRRPERAGHSMIFDTRRGVAVMFGGTTGADPGVGAPDTHRVSEAYEWNGKAWRFFYDVFGDLEYRGPTLHSMVYDSDSGTISVSGGAFYYFLTQTYNDWTDIDWSLLTPIYRPEGTSSYSSRFRGKPIGGPNVGQRQHHASAYDSDRKRIVIFGGTLSGEKDTRIDPDPGNRLDEAVFVPSTDGSPRYTATQLEIATPPAREGHVMVYDARRRCTVLFGGIRGDSVFDDTWEYGLGAIPRIYVDAANSGTEEGSLAHPNKSIGRSISDQGRCLTVLSIKAGDYREGTLRLTMPARMEARGGVVRIH